MWHIPNKTILIWALIVFPVRATCKCTPWEAGSDGSSTWVPVAHMVKLNSVTLSLSLVQPWHPGTCGYLKSKREWKFSLLCVYMYICLSLPFLPSSQSSSLPHKYEIHIFRKSMCNLQQNSGRTTKGPDPSEMMVWVIPPQKVTIRSSLSKGI